MRHFQASFFEFTIGNAFPYEERFSIRVDDPTLLPASATEPELRVVSDPIEARTLRCTLPPACEDAGLKMLFGTDPASANARQAAELLDTPQFRTHGEIILQPGERITLPLVFLSMQVRHQRTSHCLSSPFSSTPIYAICRLVLLLQMELACQCQALTPELSRFSARVLLSAMPQACLLSFLLLMRFNRER